MPHHNPEQLLHITQESRIRFAELDLPADHFRKKEVDELLTQLEKKLGNPALQNDAFLEQDSDGDEGLKCIICESKKKDTRFQCGHLCCCMDCSQKTNNCP